MWFAVTVTNTRVGPTFADLLAFLWTLFEQQLQYCWNSHKNYLRFWKKCNKARNRHLQIYHGNVICSYIYKGVAYFCRLAFFLGKTFWTAMLLKYQPQSVWIYFILCFVNSHKIISKIIKWGAKNTLPFKWCWQPEILINNLPFLNTVPWEHFSLLTSTMQSLHIFLSAVILDKIYSALYIIWACNNMIIPLVRNPWQKLDRTMEAKKQQRRVASSWVGIW